MTANLGTFENKDVIQATVAVTNAGDGLSKAMSVDPEIMHLGDEVYIVLRCQVAKVRHEPIKDTDCVVRVHVLKAGDAAIIDGASVADVLDKQRIRIEEAKGISRLEPVPDSQWTQLLIEQHERAEHRGGLIEGCPICDDEAALVAAEKKPARKAKA